MNNDESELSGEDHAPSPNQYEVTVVGHGITAGRKVDLPTALNVLNVLFGVGTHVGATAAASMPVAAASVGESARQQPLSLREFLEETFAKSIPAKITAIGRYIRDHERQSDFTREEVRSRFRLAGEVMPANLHRDFQKAVIAGWVGADPQDKTRFYVTRRGDDAVDSKFEVSVPTARKRRRGVTTRISETEEEQNEQSN